MRSIFILLFLLNIIYAKYLSNESCSECHEKIYSEFQTSYHSKTYFNDQLHRKIANKVSKKSYKCAICHMPSANNLDDLISSKARPDVKNVTHSDAISCYFCHTIAYVKKSHKFFLNVKAKQVEGFKPSFYGTLRDVDHNDKHESLKNPIYTKNVCKGCHAYKLNDYNTTVFRNMKDGDNSQSCIKCHMPKIDGGGEKFNRKSRMKHSSHRFLGIHDKAFRATGVDINATFNSGNLNIKLKNKMGHPLIIQSARAKFLKIDAFKDGKVIWQNYKDNPSEDKQGYFSSFYKKDGKKIIIPNLATSARFNNIDANSTKVLQYSVPKNADKIEIGFFVQFAKDDCLKVLDGLDKNYTTPQLIKRVKLELNK